MKKNWTKENTCIDCGKKITGYAQRCRECYAQYLISIGARKGKNNGKYIDGRSLKSNFCVDCGVQINWQSVRCKHCDSKQQSKRQLGRKGIVHSKEARKKISKANSGENNGRWKSGKPKTVQGYRLIYSPNHPCKNNRRYVLEHRLVVEKQIGRYLTKVEVVHHINEIKDDNRPQNLMCFVNDPTHHRFHKNPKNVKKSEIIFDGRKL